jgi:hypothetical protein
MSIPAYNPCDVLEKYLVTLNQGGTGIICDADELPYPKDVVKFALQYCIRTIGEAEKQNYLRSVYLSLGNFQKLSERERDAIAILKEVGPPALPGTELQDEQARLISNVAEPLQAIMARVKAEVTVLIQELKSLPGEADNRAA